MTDIERAIGRLRAVETERELYPREEAHLISLLRCKDEDDIDRRHDDHERARVSAELKSTMELIMAFEDQSSSHTANVANFVNVPRGTLKEN